MPQGNKKENGAKEIFEVTEKFPKLMTDTKQQLQEALKTPSRINAPKPTCRHIIFKLNIRENREITPGSSNEAEKHLNLKETRMRIQYIFLSETMQSSKRRVG